MRALVHHTERLIGRLQVGRDRWARRDLSAAGILGTARPAVAPYLDRALLSIAGALLLPLTASAADAPPAPAASAPTVTWPVPPMLGAPILVPGGPYQWLEGARWDLARDRLLFTDVHGATLYELTRDGAINPLRTATNKANNLELDPQGRLVACEITGRVSRYSLTDGSLIDAVTDYAGHTLKFPNDLAILANGTIFFSDSRYPRIFRVDPAGRLQGAVPEGSGDAGVNGLALSPDQKILYGAYTQAREVRAFAIDASGQLTGPRLVAKTEKAPDGLCVDREGHLYVGTTAGVQVFTPAGQCLGVLPLPNLGPKERVTKCVFGGRDGRTLFVLVPGKLFRVPAQIPGWPSP